MRILLVLAHNRLTGVNTWAYTLTKEFIKHGHEVKIEISSTESNDFLPDEKFTVYYDLLKKSNIDYYVNIPGLTKVDYNYNDVVIISYGAHASKLIDYHGKKIYVLHGMPNRFNDSYKVPEGFFTIAVSQFLMEWWNCHTHITHGIDTEFFRPLADLPVLNNPPKKALYITRYIDDDIMLRVLHKAEIGVQIASTETPDALVELIQQSDFVVAYGRSCYEAMACGKPVFVGGTNGIDGWIHQGSLPIFLYKNCSGYLNHVGNEALDKIVYQLKYNYALSNGNNNRYLAVKWLNSENMYLKYMFVIEHMGGW